MLTPENIEMACGKILWSREDREKMLVAIAKLRR